MIYIYEECSRKSVVVVRVKLYWSYHLQAPYTTEQTVVTLYIIIM